MNRRSQTFPMKTTSCSLATMKVLFLVSFLVANLVRCEGMWISYLTFCTGAIFKLKS